MTKLNAERYADTITKVMEKPYGIFQMPNGEFVVLQLPFKMVARSSIDGPNQTRFDVVENYIA